MTTVQKATAPMPGSMVITLPNQTSAPSSETSIIDHRFHRHGAAREEHQRGEWIHAG